MRPIAIFYHCLFAIGDPPEILPRAFGIVNNQISIAHESGLLDAASHVTVGINGGEESIGFADMCFHPDSRVVFHGLKSRSENLTIIEIEKWVHSHPDWYVLYFHAKGCTHPASDAHRDNWRDCMMHHLVRNWRHCVRNLENGFDSVGCHWMTGQAQDGSQNIWAGNFWWANSSFLATLPSMFNRATIKEHGVASFANRFEAEVWIGNGPRLPRVVDYHRNWRLDLNH